MSARTAELRPIRHFTRRGVIGLVVLIAAAIVSGLLLLLILRWSPLEQVDRGIANRLDHMVAGHQRTMDVLGMVSTLGRRPILWWLAIVTAGTMLARRQPRFAVFLTVTGLGAIVLDQAVRLLVGRWRPLVTGSAPMPAGDGFPSAYAVTATVFCGAMVLVFMPIVPRRLRGLVIGSVMSLVAAIGLSRIALGASYASDVAVGWLLGIAWLAVTTYAFRQWRAEIGLPRRPIGEGLEPEAAAGLAPTKIVPFRHPWRATGELLIAWVLIGAVLVGIGTVVTSHAPSFDDAVPRWFAAHGTPGLTTLSEFLSMPGSTRPILAVGLAVGPVAIALIGRWRPAVFLVLIMLGEVLLFVTVAALVGRPRPDVPQLDGHLPTAAFPSGHTAATMCLYGALAVLVVPRTRGSWRWLAVAVAVALPALVGLSRMYRGAHHPLDVLGGIVLALLWLSVVTLAVRPNADLYDLVDRPVPPDHATPIAGVPAVEDKTVVPSPGVQEAT